MTAVEFAECLGRVQRSLAGEEVLARMERIPGHWFIFGFVACTLIIIFSKVFGHAGIMRGEDYYDE